MDQLQKATYCLADGLSITAAEVTSKLEVALGDVHITCLPEPVKQFGQIIRNEAEVIGVKLIAQLRVLPAWQIGMDSVEERDIHFLRHRIEQVRGARDRLD